MGKDRDEERQNRADKIITYILIFVITVTLAALVCFVGVVLFMHIFGDGGEDSRHFGRWLGNIFSGGKSFILLVVVTIAFITSIPGIIRGTKQQQQKRSERNKAFLGQYFQYDKEVRNGMIHILDMMDGELWSAADKACVRLLQDCYVPEEQAVILFCRMICQEEQGYTREAIESGEKAIALRKDYMPALLKTVELCIQINRLTAAEQHLLEARNLSPRDIQISKILCQVYDRMHDHEKALAAAMYWEALEPASAEAAACVCRAAHKCGRPDIADSRLQKCASAHYWDIAALRKEVRGY